MSFPKKHSHPVTPLTEETLAAARKAIDDHSQALYEQFKNYTPDQIKGMKIEEYEKIRRRIPDELYYGLHQENYYPGALRDAIKEKERREREGFISGPLQQQIADYCRQEPLFDHAWGEFTRRVRKELDDHIAEGFCQVVSRMIREYYAERDRLNTRNLDNIRLLGTAARSVMSAFEDAQARNDVAYLEAAIEELDAALYDLTQKETP